MSKRKSHLKEDIILIGYAASFIWWGVSALIWYHNHTWDNLAMVWYALIAMLTFNAMMYL